MSRHQANRRRTYGRRQHEIHEREPQPMEGPASPEPLEAEWSRVQRAAADESRPLPLGDLLGHHRWRWVAGRG